MAKRKIIFTNNEYYHIFNRGTDKRVIFTNKNLQYFFLRRMVELNNTDVNANNRNSRNNGKENFVFGDGEKLVEVVAYCLLPNHFHFVLKQLIDGGISKYMQRLGSSYSTLFNQEYGRTGGLFQGKFKAKHISGDYSLPTVATYVNLNYKHHFINPKENLVKSSIFEYYDSEVGDKICSEKEVQKVMQMVGGVSEYKKYSKQISNYFIDKREVLYQQNEFEV
jgi:REP element-mobilizing transposase RayT